MVGIAQFLLSLWIVRLLSSLVAAKFSASSLLCWWAGGCSSINSAVARDPLGREILCSLLVSRVGQEEREERLVLGLLHLHLLALPLPSSSPTPPLTSDAHHKILFFHFTCFFIDLSSRSWHGLQIRRYVYNDVIRLEDMERLIDCSLVQVS